MAAIDESEKICWTCKSQLKRILVCSQCQEACYCDQRCQQIDWHARHKVACSKNPILLKMWQNVPGIMPRRINDDPTDESKGVFTSVFIPAKTAVLQDASCLVGTEATLVPKNVMTLFRKSKSGIPPYYWLMMHDHSLKSEKQRIVDLIRKNAFRMDQYSLLYFCVSFFRHSCRPNCSIAHLSTKDQQDMRFCRIVTLQDIQPDEELTISYHELSLLGEYEERRTALKTVYGFDCTCPVCQEGPGSEDDKLRIELHRIYQRIEYLAKGQNLMSVNAEVTELLRRIKEDIAPKLYPPGHWKINPALILTELRETRLRYSLNQPDKDLHLRVYHDWIALQGQLGRETDELAKMFVSAFNEKPPLPEGFESQ
jgi:hypothetical protein